MSTLGYHHTEETRRKISEAILKLPPRQPHRESSKRKMAESKWGERNPSWKGDGVGYAALHEWLTRRIPKPIYCVSCGTRYAMDLANISGKYTRDLLDWQWLCRHCHMILDGRINKLQEANGKWRHQKNKEIK